LIGVPVESFKRIGEKDISGGRAISLLIDELVVALTQKSSNCAVRDISHSM
jgi:hypothetical protein